MAGKMAVIKLEFFITAGEGYTAGRGFFRPINSAAR